MSDGFFFLVFFLRNLVPISVLWPKFLQRRTRGMTVREVVYMDFPSDLVWAGKEPEEGQMFVSECTAASFNAMRVRARRSLL